MPELATRSARQRLERRGAPYWVKIARGRALGYATGEPGTWKVRLYAGDTSSGYRFGTLGTADDLAHQEADGEQILTYAQALAAAAEWNPYDDPGPDDPADAPEFEDDATVADICEAYIKWAEENTKSPGRSRNAYDVHIEPELGDVPVAKLTTRRIRRWHRKLAKTPARTRSPEHGEQQYQDPPETKEEKRARKASANRVLTVLKAALHRQWLGERVAGPWSSVKPFPGKQVQKSRARHLDPAEVRRLLNAIDEPEFRDLVAAALLTGCRYGELSRLRAKDVHVGTDRPSIVIEDSKSGDSRAVFLNADGARLFGRRTAGRAGGERVFAKPDGEPWGKSHQSARMQAACETAKIDPAVTFHQLRHSYASSYLMAGGSPTSLAKQLGHAGTGMIEAHYGHLTDRFRAEEAQRTVPSLGVEDEGDNVQQIQAQGA